MKKRIIISIILIVVLVLLFPIRSQLKDGGTVEYKSLLYKVSKVHSLTSIEEMDKDGKVKPYDDGIIIEILGFELYNSVK